MASVQNSTSANGLGTGVLRNVKSDYDKEKAEQLAAEAVQELVTDVTQSMTR